MTTNKFGKGVLVANILLVMRNLHFCLKDFKYKLYLLGLRGGLLALEWNIQIVENKYGLYCTTLNQASDIFS